MKIYIDNIEIKNAYKVEIIVNQKTQDDIKSDHVSVYSYIDGKPKEKHIKHINGITYGSLISMDNMNLYIKSFKGTYD